MSRHAFFIAGDRVVHVANPCGAGFRYQAQAHVLLPGQQAEAQMHPGAETVLAICEGMFEVMLNGAAGVFGPGAFVRIPAGTWFAYRNAGDEPARLLCRTAPPSGGRYSCSVTFHLTAA